MATKKSPKPQPSRMGKGTKALVTILIGLAATLAVMVSGIVLLSVLEDADKTAKPISQETPIVTSHNIDQPPSSPRALPPDQVDALKRYEGERSTFQPELAFEPNEVILAAPPKGFEDRIRSAGFRIKEYVNLGAIDLQIVRIETPKGMSLDAALRKLATLLPGVTIDANHHFEASAVPGTNAREMAGWGQLSPACGKGLKIGQIDSGVDVSHPALDGQNVHYQIFAQSGRKAGPANHGTAVAAMLVGKASWGGLLPGAELFAANMFEINEKGKKVGSSMGLLKAINWLSKHKVHAINMSIAGGDNKVIRKALRKATSRNLLMIAAAGNWGSVSKRAYPAAYSEVVAVTATRGTELIYSHANQGDYIDFAAPGVGIYTAQPGGGGKPQSGTSFAVPYITAMAAILYKAGRTPNAASLRKALSRATRDLGKPGKDQVFGFGYVKARPVCK
ncbi:S8 family serine peptidase [Magnetovibrio sp. PR-2]|uniref:S8 family serine peptidase n=1 Tax=Magnetovibrio sp. PR-2 TaxID=3120356 RepID=UPI002FCDF1D2